MMYLEEKLKPEIFAEAIAKSAEAVSPTPRWPSMQLNSAVFLSE
jgi:hypothetical protein